MKLAVTAFSMALCMYTAIPLPLRGWDERARPLMLVFFPLVGLVVGLLWYGLTLLMGLLKVPNAVFAALDRKSTRLNSSHKADITQSRFASSA